MIALICESVQRMEPAFLAIDVVTIGKPMSLHFP